mmetsp:Transcript_4285/g.6261  ORF Transcript_4285/g.6261 Transcript_4285/m.6261 type:complete len:88 (-) Transcript_4285:76-339(-)
MTHWGTDMAVPPIIASAAAVVVAASKSNSRFEDSIILLQMLKAVIAHRYYFYCRIARFDLICLLSRLYHTEYCLSSYYSPSGTFALP